MKIAISARGPNLEAEVEPRFGRCPFFLVIDTDTRKFEAVDNSSAGASGGAGISAAQMIAGKGVVTVLTGNCGPNAYQTLSAAGIKVITGVSGIVKTVLDDYRSGKFQDSTKANVPDHFGINAGTRDGSGFGRRICRGMGRGAGYGSGPAISSDQLVKSEEIVALKEESRLIARRLDDIQQRIETLEKRSK
jgi:predicted Fe-Mo cluster-binding NifX family protein